MTTRKRDFASLEYDTSDGQDQRGALTAPALPAKIRRHIHATHVSPLPPPARQNPMALARHKEDPARAFLIFDLPGEMSDVSEHTKIKDAGEVSHTTKTEQLKPKRIKMYIKERILARAPAAAADLQDHTEAVIKSFGLNPRYDLKLNPGKYGATLRQDLGLCFVAFFTEKECPRGAGCPWRHHRIRSQERNWIRELGASAALEWILHCYDTPKIPELTPWYPCTVKR